MTMLENIFAISKSNLSLNQTWFRAKAVTKEAMKIPRSIPKKFHSHIYAIERGDGYSEGVCWDVFTFGISDEWGSHAIIEPTLAEVVERLKMMTPCDCPECLEHLEERRIKSPEEILRKIIK